MSVNDRITKKVNEVKTKHENEISKFLIHHMIKFIDNMRRNYEIQLNKMQAALSTVNQEVTAIQEAHAK